MLEKILESQLRIEQARLSGMEVYYDENDKAFLAVYFGQKKVIGEIYTQLQKLKS